MFTSIKLFFGTPLGKNVLIGIAVALLLAAVWTAGNRSGYESGQTAGVKAGIASQKPTIDRLTLQVDALTDKINTDTKERNDKIHELESTVAQQYIDLQVAKSVQSKKRDDIVNDYINSVPPEVQNSCGLDVITVKAINALIDTQIVDPVSPYPLEEAVPKPVAPVPNLTGDSK